jgi:hypothetical protein
MINMLPFFLDNSGDVSAGLLLLAFAILLIAILIDDDDLPGPRLYRVPAKNRA